MFLNSAARLGVMKVAVVQVVGVAVMLALRVPAAGAVLVRVIGVRVRRAHWNSSLVRLSRRCRFQFGGVVQRVLDQTGNMPIR